MQLNFLMLIFICIFSLNLCASERYVCKHDIQNSIKLITNFYILDKKLVMSGATGNGEYNIIYKNEDGLLAINSSHIGDEFGLETVLLNNKFNSFKYKTFINRQKNNSTLEIRGTCFLAN